MNDFERLSEIVALKKAELNEIYKNLNDELIERGLKICKLSGTSSERIAVARRVIDLKVDPLENELKKLGRDESEILRVKRAMYEFVREVYEQRHASLLQLVRDEKILEPFYEQVLVLMHEVGCVINAWQPRWEAHIIDDMNVRFDDKFKDLAQANEFFVKNELFMRDENSQKADRVYGAAVLNGDKFELKPYASAFEDEVSKIALVFEKNIKILISLALQASKSKTLSQENSRANLSKNSNPSLDVNSCQISGENFTNDAPSSSGVKNNFEAEILAQYASYINYFSALKDAFCELDNDRVIPAWQAAEGAWMGVTGKLQPGHPLEYYEDAYLHAVALEWDVRLASGEQIDESEFKAKILDSFEQICSKIGVQNPSMNAQVHQNVSRTQLYVSVPMIYYGAELNGLFSAQVVPNDESVSAKYGKKIFAFVDHVYESAKAKPFMRLGAEIFSRDFLDFGREILFLKPKIWKKVYEISTIGHEFGHILFIDKDTENKMNAGGLFKFIEEYKATSGGLVNFFLHEEDEYKMAVLHELIARAVGLIGWMKVGEVRAYYCEALIHLSLLFKAGVLKFTHKKLDVDFSLDGYERFKLASLANNEALASHYAHKREAGEFLAKFCEPYNETYLPKDPKTRAFVEYFYTLYEEIGNEIDTSDEWAKWQKRANAL